MKTYIAQWEDGSISIISAEDKTDLFWKLDTESDPTRAKITLVSDDDNDGIHVSTYLHTNKKGETSIKIHAGECSERFRKVPWKQGDTLKAMQYLNPEATGEVVEALCPQWGITYK